MDLNPEKENSNKAYRAKKAEINWDKKTPKSPKFNDIYYSPKNGLAESQYVFLENNNLEERWQSLEKNKHFTIAETGFGTGLNFLAASQLWEGVLNNSLNNQHLQFISFEKYPVSTHDLKKAHSDFPELELLSEQLINIYPKIISGTHRLHLSNNIHLTLVFYCHCYF